MRAELFRKKTVPSSETTKNGTTKSGTITDAFARARQKGVASLGELEDKQKGNGGYIVL